jgi:hypothetical protein
VSEPSFWFKKGREDGSKGIEDPPVHTEYEAFGYYMHGHREGNVIHLAKGQDGFKRAVEHIFELYVDGLIDSVLAMDLIGIARLHRDENTVTITKDLLDRLVEKQRHYDMLELAVTSGNVLDDLRMLRKLATTCKVKDVVANLAEELQRMASVERRYQLLQEAAESTDPVEGFRKLRVLSDWCPPRRAVLSIIGELLRLREKMASSGGCEPRSPDPEGS